MLNHVVVIGKVVEMPIMSRDNQGNKKISFVLEIERAYRESDGEYKKDYIRIVPWRGIAEQMKDLCTIGSIIAVKGRFCCEDSTSSAVEIIAENITFLSTRMK